MSTGGIKPPPPSPPPALITGKLGIPQQPFTNLNKTTGSTQNAINDLTFFFPGVAVRAVQEGALIASFAALKAKANAKAQSRNNHEVQQDTGRQILAYSPGVITEIMRAVNDGDLLPFPLLPVEAIPGLMAYILGRGCYRQYSAIAELFPHV